MAGNLLFQRFDPRRSPCLDHPYLFRHGLDEERSEDQPANDDGNRPPAIRIDGKTYANNNGSSRITGKRGFDLHEEEF
jgi:hypothetical protein